MNAQELLGLQEAYLGLYGEVLEEGSLADMFSAANDDLFKQSQAHADAAQQRLRRLNQSLEDTYGKVKPQKSSSKPKSTQERLRDIDRKLSAAEKMMERQDSEQHESYDLDEAKFEKDKDKWEKEEIRNVRTFGSSANRERATGMRRTLSTAARGAKKELPTGNEPTTLNPKYDSKNETKKQLEVQRSRQRNRQFNADLRREREAKKYANQVNSRFRADSAENDIKQFRREEVELVLSYLLDEGYANTPEEAQVILDNMSEGWKSELVKGAIKAVGRGVKRTTKKAKREIKNPVKATVKRATKRAGKFALGTLLGLPL